MKEIAYPSFLRLLLIVFFLNLAGAQILHESGHWVVLTLYGRQPVWGFTSMVQLWDRAPRHPQAWTEFTDPDGDTGWLGLSSLPGSDFEWLLFLVAGPGMQVLAVLAGFALAGYSGSLVWRTYGFLWAIVNAFGQTFYQVVSLLRGGGGDERLIGDYLGVPFQAVHIVFLLFFVIALVIAYRRLPDGRARWLYTGALFLGTLPVGPLLMIANRLVIDGVDSGSPFFTPVLGFSLPVLLTAIVSLLGLAFTAGGLRGVQSHEHEDLPNLGENP